MLALTAPGDDHPAAQRGSGASRRLGLETVRATARCLCPTRAASSTLPARHKAYRIPASRRASATTAIRLPRRAAMGSAQCRSVLPTTPWRRHILQAAPTTNARICPLPCLVIVPRCCCSPELHSLGTRPSAESSDLFWHDQMRFPLTTIVGIDTRFECVCAQQPVRFRHGTFPMDPLRFDGVEPWACAGPLADHEAHPDRAPLDLLIVLAEPVPYGVAPVP